MCRTSTSDTSSLSGSVIFFFSSTGVADGWGSSSSSCQTAGQWLEQWKRKRFQTYLLKNPPPPLPPPHCPHCLSGEPPHTWTEKRDQTLLTVFDMLKTFSGSKCLQLVNFKRTVTETFNITVDINCGGNAGIRDNPSIVLIQGNKSAWSMFVWKVLPWVHLQPCVQLSSFRGVHPRQDVATVYMDDFDRQVAHLTCLIQRLRWGKRQSFFSKATSMRF